jgi:hypothetical protein
MHPGMELTKGQQELLRAAAAAEQRHVWTPRVLSLARAQPEWEALKQAGYFEQIDGDRLRITALGLAAIGAEKPESLERGASNKAIGATMTRNVTNSEPSAFEVD